MVCTGAGIGVNLAPILQLDTMWTLFWVARDYQETYGGELMDMIEPLVEQGRIILSVFGPIWDSYTGI